MMATKTPNVPKTHFKRKTHEKHGARRVDIVAAVSIFIRLPALLPSLSLPLPAILFAKQNSAVL